MYRFATDSAEGANSDPFFAAFCGSYKSMTERPLRHRAFRIGSRRMFACSRYTHDARLEVQQIQDGTESLGNFCCCFPNCNQGQHVSLSCAVFMSSFCSVVDCLVNMCYSVQKIIDHSSMIAIVAKGVVVRVNNSARSRFLVSLVILVIAHCLCPEPNSRANPASPRPQGLGDVCVCVPEGLHCCEGVQPIWLPAAPSLPQSCRS